MSPRRLAARPAAGGSPARSARKQWVSWTQRLRLRHVRAVALAATLTPAGVAVAAPPDFDRPAGAADFTAVTAENGTPAELEAVLAMGETTPDGGVPRCLGPASFARTAWAWIPAAGRPRRIVVEATPAAQLGGDPVSTTTPDLALYPQDPVTRSTADVSEPAACDGRESLAAIAASASRAGGGRLLAGAAGVDLARGDGSAAVAAYLRAGRPALVQVGWREGDAAAPLLVTLAASGFDKRPLPAGDDPADAPRIALGAATAVPLSGATLGLGDPAQPACPAPATIWRRVAVPGPGAYAVAADGAAQTLSVFRAPAAGAAAASPAARAAAASPAARAGAESPAARAGASASPPARAAADAAPAADDALACADRADAPAPLGVAVRAERAGELWLRVGVDDPLADANARLLVTGPYADAAAAADALPPAGRPLDRAAPACIRARAPRLALGAASLRALRTRAGRTLAGTLRQPCDRRRPQATRVGVSLTRTVTPTRRRAANAHIRAAKTRNRAAVKPRFVRASGVARWSRRLPRVLTPGRYALRVRAVVVRRDARGKRRARVVASLNRTLVVRTKGSRR